MSQTRKQPKPPTYLKKAYNFDKNIRSMVTPEGFDLRLRLAKVGTRFWAFIVDFIIIVAVILTLIFFLFWLLPASVGAAKEIIISIAILVLFFLRNFYFMFFEMQPKAATLGKRLMKIRVADRRGGHLTAGAIFARNAMREIEFFLPLGMVFSSGNDVGGWMALLAFVWSMIFLLFPLFNKDRLRVGDLIAGTWVIQAPRNRLSKDLSAAKTNHEPFTFSNEQIDAYGVKELHVLENILRTDDPKIINKVTKRIIKKIKWDEPSNYIDVHKIQRKFLSAYYAALRGKLEMELLFGVRRKDKFDKAKSKK
ncbi:MAG: RDD family protein [Robiginitomaculum sp.]